jgi:hypothetical protein
VSSALCHRLYADRTINGRQGFRDSCCGRHIHSARRRVAAPSFGPSPHSSKAPQSPELNALRKVTYPFATSTMAISAGSVISLSRLDFLPPQYHLTRPMREVHAAPPFLPSIGPCDVDRGCCSCDCRDLYLYAAWVRWGAREEIGWIAPRSGSHCLLCSTRLR